MSGRSFLLSFALLALMPAAATALPGDPPLVPLTPADGATVPANPAGIPVSYQCPAYTSEVYGDPADPIISRGGPGDYSVTFSSSPAIGANGVIAATFGSDSPSVGPDGATCTSELDTYDSTTSPEIVGGRVYWQASRPCSGCTGQRPETGPVRSFVVRPAPVEGTLRSQPRLYAGYLSVFTVTPGTAFARETLLQRRVGKTWRTFAQGGSSEPTELIGKLPAGRHEIRAVLMIGDQAVQAATRKVNVRRGGRRVTSARDNGRYAARNGPNNDALTFKVGRGGTVLKSFKATVAAYCIGATLSDNHIQISFAALRSARIAPDGTVVGLLKLKSGARTVLTGRLRNRRFKGKVSLSFSTCGGSRRLDAAPKR